MSGVALKRLRLFTNVLEDLLCRDRRISSIDLPATALLGRQLERNDRHALVEDIGIRQPEVGYGLGVDSDLLRRHDALERRVTGLVHPLLRGDDRRERSFDDLLGPLDLAMSRDSSLARFHMGNDVDLRIAEELRDHRPNERVVGAYPLLAEED